MDVNEWEEFCIDMTRIYKKVKEGSVGVVATYIPQWACLQNQE